MTLKTLIVSTLAVLVSTGLFAQYSTPHPEMVMETTEGVIVIELFEEQAPKSVANIIQYAEDGFYEGTIFHRIISGFMVQGGGFGQDMVKRPVGEGIANESKNGLKNDRGTVALARTGDPHSATAQFYINLVNNDSLNYPRKLSPGETSTTEGSERVGWGYAVFGRVVEGMDVVDRMARTRTRTVNGRPDVPVVPIVIEKVTIRRPDGES